MSLLGEIGYALIATSGRAIGPVIPDVVIEEAGRDGLIITSHPVEKGAAITDHAFRRPSECEMRVGFSNASAGDAGYVKQVYRQLLALQVKRQPFTVFTGKRRYANMLLGDLAQITDKHSEFSLLIQCRLQEVIIVSTRRAGTGTDTTKAGAGAPAGTEGTADKGDQSGASINDQSFAGSFNPGGFNTEGGTLGPGGFGDGISPAGPPEITLPEQEVSPSTPGGSGVETPHDIWQFG